MQPRASDKISYLAFVASLALTACGPKVQVKTTETNVAIVGHYKTYSYDASDSAPTGFAKTGLTSPILERVRLEVDAEMQRRGYTRTADGRGDLVIHIAAGTRQVLDPPSVATERHGDSASVDTERGIAIEIARQGSPEKLFHGYARYEAEPNSIDAGKIHAAVVETLAGVPNSAR